MGRRSLPHGRCAGGRSHTAMRLQPGSSSASPIRSRAPMIGSRLLATWAAEGRAAEEGDGEQRDQQESVRNARTTVVGRVVDGAHVWISGALRPQRISRRPASMSRPSPPEATSAPRAAALSPRRQPPSRPLRGRRASGLPIGAEARVWAGGSPAWRAALCLLCSVAPLIGSDEPICSPPDDVRGAAAGPGAVAAVGGWGAVTGSAGGAAGAVGGAGAGGLAATGGAGAGCGRGAGGASGAGGGLAALRGGSSSSGST